MKDAIALKGVNVYVVVVNERGAPETSIAGVFENFEDAERTALVEGEGYDKNDVHVLQMPLNAVERRYV